MSWYVTQQMTAACPDPLRQGTGSVWGWRRANTPPQGRGGFCITALKAPVAELESAPADFLSRQTRCSHRAVPACWGSAWRRGASPDEGLQEGSPPPSLRPC